MLTIAICIGVVCTLSHQVPRARLWSRVWCFDVVRLYPSQTERMTNTVQVLMSTEASPSWLVVSFQADLRHYGQVKNKKEKKARTRTNRNFTGRRLVHTETNRKTSKHTTVFLKRKCKKNKKPTKIPLLVKPWNIGKTPRNEIFPRVGAGPLIT